MHTPTATAVQGNGAAAAAAQQRRYALGVLMVVAVFNYIDRQALSILQVPIKQELGLSDTQLGALTGLAFALLYSTLALPIARLADRRSRKLIIAAALAIWSLMTAGCGLATGFVTLVIFRLGVAFGEAGCVPPTHSLIADYYPREQRARALAIWTLSLPIGVMLGFLAGGWLEERFGWRGAFLVLGIIGLAIVPLVLATLREPLRGAQDAAPPAAQPSLRESIRTLWRLRAFRHATWAGALLAYTLHATLNWNAPFYSRVHGMGIGEIGTYLALVLGIGGGLGIYLGGILADSLGRRDARAYMWVPAAAAFGVLPFVPLQYLSDDVRLSLIIGVVPALLLNSYFPSLVATSQSLVPANLRAFTSAVLVLVVNIVGMGLGPFVTGMISDAVSSATGDVQSGLRYALLTVCVPALWAGWHFLRAARWLPQELGRS